MRLISSLVDRPEAPAVEPFIVQSEFAMVEVRLDDSANGSRLHIKDLGSDDEIYLDPLELEALTRVSHEFFVPLVAPATRERPQPADDRGL